MTERQRDETDYRPTPEQLAHTKYIKQKSAEKVTDADKRAKEREFGSSSPVVSAIEIEYRHRIEDRIKLLLAKAASPATGRYVVGVDVQLVKLMQQFCSDTVVTPGVDEIAQPQLGMVIVAGAAIKAAVDACYRAENRSVSTLDLADDIADILRAELRLRHADNSNDALVLAAAGLARGAYATKARSTLDYRLSNINRVLNDANAFGITSGGSKRLKEAAQSLLGLMAEELDGKPPLLQKMSASTIRLSEAVWEELKDKKAFLERRSWSHIPMNTPPLPWRYTGNPDANNATGGYHDRRIRGRFPLGHGKHALYLTTASREALAALNEFQATGYVVDSRVADFINTLHESGETFESWIPLIDYTTEDLEKATSTHGSIGYARYQKLPVHLQELVRQRCEMVERYGRDKAGMTTRNRSKEWDSLMKTLKYSYAEILEQQARSIRTGSIVSRLRELQSDQYPDGIWWAAGFDHRGRMYSKSDILSPQASPAERFALVFKDGERLTDDGKRQVCIAIGSALISDKLSISEREKIGRDNWQRCIEAGEDLWSVRGWLDGADDPWYLIGLCSSLYGHEVLGEQWKRPLFLDATSSVLQHLCCISNDVSAMVHCNLRATTDETSLSDAYQKTKELLDEAKQQRWKPGGVKLSWIKDKNGVYVDPEATRADGSLVYPREAQLLNKLLEARASLKLGLMTGLYGSSVPKRTEVMIAENKLTAPWQHEVAGAATRIINYAMKLVYPSSFNLLTFVKAVAKASINERLDTLDEFNEVHLYGYFGKPKDKVGFCDIGAFETLLAQANVKKRPTLDEALTTDLTRLLKTATPEEERLLLKQYGVNRREVKNSRTLWTKINEAAKLLKAFDAHNADAALSWTLPDGFTVVAREPYLELGKQVKCGVLGQITTRYESDDSIDVSKLVRASAPSLIHSYDAWLLRQLILMLDTQACCIHDSVGVLPSQINNLIGGVRTFQAQLCPDNDGRNILVKFIDDLIQDADTRNALKASLMETFPAMPDGFVFSEELQKARPWN